MIPESYVPITEKNGIERGVYHDGTTNIFCLIENGEIIYESTSSYETSMTMDLMVNLTKMKEDNDYDNMIRALGVCDE